MGAASQLAGARCPHRVGLLPGRMRAPSTRQGNLAPPPPGLHARTPPLLPASSFPKLGGSSLESGRVLGVTLRPESCTHTWPGATPDLQGK